jgi:tetratricopeptide (TPR) repeat protein
MKQLLFIALVVLIGCAEKKEQIASPADYESYLTMKQVRQYSIEDDMKFWNDRLKTVPTDGASTIKLAGLYSALFRETGDMNHLRYSDSLYHHLLKLPTEEKSGLYLALAQNSITQHNFNQAGDYAEAALREGGLKAAALLIKADVALELGDVPKAKNILAQFTNKNSFAHSIRQVKVKDHEGDLDAAIYIMEQAFNRVKGNKALYCWALSNLGDLYGHAGRIHDAYQAYLAVLRKDPAYDYALKGIAWIALSNDHNYTEAKRIINILMARKQMPEAHLILAEIAELEGNDQEKLNQLNNFVTLADREGYATMYAKYLAGVYADDLNLPAKSMAIAEQEILNRPTPQSFDLKAWALHALGKDKEALLTAQKYVEGKTFEPDALYHLGMIYYANGFEKEAEKYLGQSLESSFELGPVATRNIQHILKTM